VAREKIEAHSAPPVPRETVPRETVPKKTVPPSPGVPSTAAIQLVVMNGPSLGLTVPLEVGCAYTIGRGKKADICISDRFASRVNTRIERLETGLHATDLESANGTEVNGVPCDHSPLHVGDDLLVGRTKVRITLADTQLPEQSAKSKRPSPEWQPPGSVTSVFRVPEDLDD
jgi:pSer/pThr/pTyr-binding forkhead associated (FHA) protein